MEDIWIILIISFLSGSTTVIGALLAMFLKGKEELCINRSWLLFWTHDSAASVKKLFI